MIPPAPAAPRPPSHEKRAGATAGLPAVRPQLWRESPAPRHPFTPSPAHLFTCSPAHPSPAHLFTCSPAHPVTRSPLHLLTRSPLHPVTRSPLHLLTCSPLHPVTRSPLHRLTGSLFAAWVPLALPVPTPRALQPLAPHSRPRTRGYEILNSPRAIPTLRHRHAKQRAPSH